MPIAHDIMEVHVVSRDGLEVPHVRLRASLEASEGQIEMRRGQSCIEDLVLLDGRHEGIALREPLVVLDEGLFGLMVLDLNTDTCLRAVLREPCVLKDWRISWT